MTVKSPEILVLLQLLEDPSFQHPENSCLLSYLCGILSQFNPTATLSCQICARHQNLEIHVTGPMMEELWVLSSEQEVRPVFSDMI